MIELSFVKLDTHASGPLSAVVSQARVDGCTQINGIQTYRHHISWHCLTSTHPIPVPTCRQNIIGSSASAPLNATKIVVKKVSDVDVWCMFRPEL